MVVQVLRDQIQRRVYPVHRLDRATSGVLLFALDSAGARWLGSQFQDGTVDKTYSAIVRGWPKQSGRVSHAIKAGGSGAVREASTAWTTLGRLESLNPIGRYPSARYSLIQLFPETGRRHQLRKHCAYIGHPIVGDVNYGDRHHNRFFRDNLGVTGLMLHASYLRIKHQCGHSLTLSDPMAERMRRVLGLLGGARLVGKE